MWRKTVSTILALPVLSYLGCHDTVQLTRDRFVAKKVTDEIVVVTKDQKYYRFQEHNYLIAGDSLKGAGTCVYGGTVTPFAGSLALADIDLVEHDELNGPKTVLCVLGIGAAAALIAAAVFAAALANSFHGLGGWSGGKSSCPFVYTYDGTMYHFESETFSGAVLKGLERTSYDNLRYLKPVDGACRLRLSNEREETEYVNELKLIAVDHDASCRIIPDMKGNIHTVSGPLPPQVCTDFGNHDARRAIASRDSIFWESDLTAKDFRLGSDLRDGLVLEFAKPPEATVAKLLVAGINTQLGTFALERVFQLKGDDKLLWYQQLERNPAERAKFRDWLMREGMLHVKVWKNGQWTDAGAFPDVGPSLEREQVTLLSVGDIAGSTLRVKLECTTDLWRIDQVSVDYTPDRPVAAAELTVRSAVNERGENVASLLEGADDRYYVTVAGEQAELIFDDPAPQPGRERSYVLKTSGFYYPWIDAHGPEYAETLEKVLTEPRYAAERYLPEWRNVKKAYTNSGN